MLVHLCDFVERTGLIFVYRIRDNMCCFGRVDFFFFFQAEDGIRDLVRSRGLGDVYKRQMYACASAALQSSDGCISTTCEVKRPIRMRHHFFHHNYSCKPHTNTASN
eukprot:TRINITY_DN4479_c0_g1_i1.p3 TRINITY_DN4479_c0_g1~~TRINITY_DN4479_c0_g1_i1.p3  ORF type:complete len:107 (+),score=20.25 TRINITY_DN4479_c0_g1_i1:21-341(+)